MLLSILKYVLISGLLLSLFIQTEAQDNLKDTTRLIQKPTGIRIGTDLISLGKNFSNHPFSGWEVNADMDFGRYYLAFDYGSWAREVTLSNGAYENDGRYFRLGVDVNFLLKDPDKNMFFVGFRYGRANFTERLVYEFTAYDFGNFQQEVSNIGATSGWGEMTIGLRVKIWKQFWMGYTGRMKFFPGVRNNPGFDTYEVPGFGLVYKNIYWGFNYQVFWRMPIRNQK